MIRTKLEERMYRIYKKENGKYIAQKFKIGWWYEFWSDVGPERDKKYEAEKDIDDDKKSE